MQRKETPYTYSTMYIMIYRHAQSDLVYNMIKPFTVDDRLFQKLLDVMIFVDTESGIAFTPLMNKEFSQIKKSPAIIRVAGCDIITKIEDIKEIMNEVYNLCVNLLSVVFEQPLFNDTIYQHDDHYITEQIYNNPSVMDTTNGGLLQDYATQYQQENLNRTQLQYPERPVSNGPQCAQIKDVPIKNLTVATGDAIKTNLSSMQLNI